MMSSWAVAVLGNLTLFPMDELMCELAFASSEKHYALSQNFLFFVNIHFILCMTLNYNDGLF